MSKNGFVIIPRAVRVAIVKIFLSYHQMHIGEGHRLNIDLTNLNILFERNNTR